MPDEGNSHPNATSVSKILHGEQSSPHQLAGAHTVLSRTESADQPAAAFRHDLDA
ncbi:hypothetical protein [Nocardia gipuzkoensis]|jgi:hypothetical protein|nr:hypothetical protein [Nocardia abscessus]